MDFFGWQLPSIALVVVWLGALYSVRYSGWRLALLGLWGTILHEAMHLLTGIVLGAKPTSVNLLPRRTENGWILGSVSFSRLTIWNAAPVAFAPLGLLGIAWLLYQHWMLPAFAAGVFTEWIFAGYIVACAIFSCCPSTTDIKVGMVSVLLYGLIGYGLWFLVQR